MKLIYVFFIVCAFGLANVSAEPINDIGKKVDKQIKIQKPAKDLKQVNPKNQDPIAVKPENKAGALCSPNDTQSCTTNSVTKGDQQCKQDVCTCVNSGGNSTYASTGATYACVEKIPDVPAETKPVGG